MSRRKIPQVTERPQVKRVLRHTGERLRQARESRGWSQEALGERMGGVDRRTIAAMESGHPNISFGLAVSAMWMLDVSMPSVMSPSPSSDSKVDEVTDHGTPVKVTKGKSPPRKAVRTDRVKRDENLQPIQPVTAQQPDRFDNDF